MRNHLERIVAASDIWIRNYEDALKAASHPASRVSRRPHGVREHAHRLPGLSMHESIEHSLRLARTVRSKAEQLAALDLPHGLDMQMVRVMACQLCKLNRETRCEVERAAQGCELGLY